MAGFEDIIGALAPRSSQAARMGKIASLPGAFVDDVARVPLSIADAAAGFANQVPERYPNLSQLVQNLAPIAANMGGDPMAASKIRLNQSLIPYYEARQQEALANAGAVDAASSMSTDMMALVKTAMPGFDPSNPGHLAQARSLIADQWGPAGVEEFDKGFDTAQTSRRAMDRSDDYAKLGTEYRNVEANYRILANQREGKPLGQHAMIIAFAKMLDPDSVVRTSEGEAIQETGGAAQHAQVFMNYWTGGGEKLSPDQEKALRSAAASVMAARRIEQKDLYDRFGKESEALGMGRRLNEANLPLPPAASGREYDGRGGAGGELDLVYAEAAPQDQARPTEAPEPGAKLLWSKGEGKFFWWVPRTTPQHQERVMLSPNATPEYVESVMSQGWDIMEAN